MIFTGVVYFPPIVLLRLLKPKEYDMLSGEDPDLFCQCGRERCAENNHIFFRVGPVFHGNEVADYDMLHVSVFDYFPDEKRREHSELMLSETQAKELMYYLAWYYMPGFVHLERFVRRLRYWRFCVEDWWWRLRGGGAD